MKISRIHLLGPSVGLCSFVVLLAHVGCGSSGSAGPGDDAERDAQRPGQESADADADAYGVTLVEAGSDSAYDSTPPDANLPCAQAVTAAFDVLHAPFANAVSIVLRRRETKPARRRRSIMRPSLRCKICARPRNHVRVGGLTAGHEDADDGVAHCRGARRAVVRDDRPLPRLRRVVRRGHARSRRLAEPRRAARRDRGHSAVHDPRRRLRAAARPRVVHVARAHRGRASKGRSASSSWRARRRAGRSSTRALARELALRRRVRQRVPLPRPDAGSTAGARHAPRGIAWRPSGLKTGGEDSETSGIRTGAPLSVARYSA